MQALGSDFILIFLFIYVGMMLATGKKKIIIEAKLSYIPPLT